MLGLAAGHDGERALLGAGDATRHRSVDEPDSLLLQSRCEVARRRRRDAGEIDYEFSRRSSLCDTLLAEKHFFRRMLVGDAQHHDLSGARHGRRSVGLSCSFFDHRGELVAAAVPDADLVAGSEQTQRHRPAHQPDADEPELWFCIHRLLAPLCVTAPRCAEPTRAAYFSRTPVRGGRLGCFALLCRSSLFETTRVRLPAAVSMRMRSPLRTRPSGPPAAASGET